MTALTQDQLVYIRKQVGSSPDDASLQAIYDRPVTVNQLVLEVLELRYADLIATPATFAIPGDYSQSTAENIKALAERISSWRAWMLSQGEDPGPILYGSSVYFIEPDTTPRR